jgi:hypothetical protein
MKKISLIILVAVLFSGCVMSTGNKDLSISDIPGFGKNDGKATGEKVKLPNTVAVIPFNSENQYASDIVTKYFYNSFSTLTYKDIELDAIKRVLKGKSLAQINSMDVQELGRLLGVEGIIIGTVTDFDKLFAGIYSSVTVGADIKFYDVKSGKLIWKFKENAKKREGGIALSPIGIATQLVMAAYNLREVQVYRAAEDLFRDVFKTIPQPTMTQIVNKPSIYFSVNNIKSKKAFKAGDELLFSIDAQEGLEVAVIIPTEKNLIPLKEIQKGHYEGRYIVTNNVDEASGTIEYLLRSPNGLEAKYIDIYGNLNIDNVAPVTPEVKYTLDNEKVKLEFIDNTGDEIAHYKLEKLVDGQYQSFLMSEKKYLEFDLKKGESIFLRPYLIDYAGNQSKKVSTALQINNLLDTRILKAKELPLSINDENIHEIAVIKNDTQISGNLRIKPYGVLFIDSNVKVELLNNGRIIVEGGELVINSAKGNIRIDSKNTDVTIQFDGGHGVFNNFTLNGQRGVVLKQDASLKVQNTKINTQYDALSLLDSSTVQVTFSQIAALKDMADVKVEGAAKASLSDVRFYEKNLFDVSSSSTKTSVVKSSGKIKVLGVVDVHE